MTCPVCKVGSIVNCSICDTPNWISVKKKMPEDFRAVLLFFQDEYGNEMVTGHWDESNCEFVQTARGFLESGEFDELYHKKKYITHWMPLPEQPHE